MMRIRTLPDFVFRGIGCIAYLVIGISSLFSMVSHAQSQRIIAHAAVAEKIYLQLDADVYTTDQTIWFKAIVVEAATHQLTALSGVLHVELIGPDEQLLERKRIRLTDGVGEGGFMLRERYVQGCYLLRAYTEWNQNFDADFMFQTYVDIFPASNEIRSNPITAIHLNEKQPGQYWLNAQFYPQLVDASHEKQLTVHLTIDGTKSTMPLTAERSGYYLLNHPVPAGANIATLHMETQNGIRYTKTIALGNSFLDLQFFAESGILLHGVKNKVGFKALDNRGMGVAVSGIIMDNKGNTVVPFKSNHLGMGSFSMAVDSNSSYYALLDSLPNDHVSHRYPLPEVIGEGHVLSITAAGDSMNMAVHSNVSGNNNPLLVQVSCRGLLYYLVKGVLKDDRMEVSLPVTGIPEGIVSFKLMDSNMRPLAERLFFNQRPETRLHISLSMDKTTYQKREKTELEMAVVGSDGQATEANLSVMVMNKEHVGNAWAVRQNILSRFLLASELRGEIAQPGYYFQDDGVDRSADLDALLLTQGWRKYKYDKPLQDTFLFLNEPMPYVSGRVSGVFSKREQTGVELTLMTFGQSASVATQTTDSSGRFYFPLAEEYVDSLGILIQSANKAGKNRNYTISLDEKQPPVIGYDHIRSIEQVDSVVSDLVQKRQERAQREFSYKLSTGEILLEEVVVEGRMLSPQQQKVRDRFGDARVIISGKAIQEKEEKWSYGLYSVLLFNFPNDLRIDRMGDAGGYLRASIIGGETTLVVVDGIPVLGYNYELIPNIPPSEVKSVELIRFAKNFSSLYSEVYPEVSPINIPMIGSVIAIYTHAGNGLHAVRKPTGLLQTTVPVYSPTIEFYAPRYETPSSNETERPDLRTLIHWAPNLPTDGKGKVSTNYYNADVLGKTIVVVEAISSEGEIGYQELVYEVVN